VSFCEWTHINQSDHFADTNQFPDKLVESWFDEQSADAWRHQRMYEGAELLLNSKIDKWVTIGDGRGGLDSIRLRKLGFENVLATDIAENLLQRFKDLGLIPDYAIVNAEHLPYENSSVDYFFCKESLHHFPQPYKALYEFYRVARKGFILIEPNDPTQVEFKTNQIAGAGVKRRIKNSILAFLGKLSASHFRSLTTTVGFNEPAWEPSGNYTYCFGRRDFERFAYGLGLPAFAIKGLNDHYVEGCEFEEADLKKSQKFKEIVEVIQRKDRELKLGIRQPDLNMVCFFSEMPDKNTENIFKSNDWDFVQLIPNPYFVKKRTD
jgi:ubiquinone/menaquinone biosynthesis C-methylase UbiE